MKKKLIREIRLKGIKELRQMVSKTNSELILLQTDLKAGKLKNVSALREKKHELAVAKTILKEKEILEPDNAADLAKAAAKEDK
jgi:ribosomal protein L29